MTLFWEGLEQAARLVLSRVAEVFGITLLSLGVTGAATCLALLVGLPLGTAAAGQGKSTTGVKSDLSPG